MMTLGPFRLAPSGRKTWSQLNRMDRPMQHSPGSAQSVSAELPVIFPVDWCRRQFPALGRQSCGQPAVFFDGPAGSQVPDRVIEAIAAYLRSSNANQGGLFATSRESDLM